MSELITFTGSSSVDDSIITSHRINEIVNRRSQPLSIDLDSTRVEDFSDLSSVTANVIVISDPVKPEQSYKFVRSEALNKIDTDLFPMSSLRPFLEDAFIDGRFLGGQNILGFDFPVMMNDETLDVKDVIQAFIDTRQVIDTSKYIKDRYNFRVSLKYMAAGSIGGEKLMDGANAPIEWERGNYQDVIDYCVQDTVLWSDIHRYGVENGYINIGGPKLAVDW